MAKENDEGNGKWVWAVIFFVFLLWLFFDRKAKDKARRNAPTPPPSLPATKPDDNPNVFDHRDPCECA